MVLALQDHFCILLAQHDSRIALHYVLLVFQLRDKAAIQGIWHRGLVNSSKERTSKAWSTLSSEALDSRVNSDMKR